MNLQPGGRLAVLAVVLAGAVAASAEQNAPSPETGPPSIAPDGIRHDVLRELLAASPAPGEGRSQLLAIPFRSINGRNNNFAHPFWGASQTPFLRRTPAAYGDGSGTPSGQNRVSAREVSNLCNLQSASIPNSRNATDFLWQWGQFLDHDLDLAELASPAEPFAIDVPTGDPFFDPDSTGTQVIGLERSHYRVIRGKRQQINAITSYIDASNVYGSDLERARELRTLEGTGRLKISSGGLLPYNEAGLPNAPSSDPSFFLAGDVRANEQVGLTALHTLFVREHNFWANAIAAVDASLDGEEIYQIARAIVGAEIQAITYREFLPLLLGPNGLSPYRGYRPGVNAAVSNVFATAAYRVGHTMLSGHLLRLDGEGAEIPEGHLALRDAFFRPDHIERAGIEPLLRGLAAQPAQEIDPHVIDDVRNFLFGPPGAGGFDLAALNIQRGRDHGLPSYNRARRSFGLPVLNSFAAVNPDPAVQARLAAAYSSVHDVDIWVGGLSEPQVEGAMVGETFLAILKDQFERLRDGDRFWYQHHLPAPLVSLVEDQTLARVIRRNTTIGDELQDDAFRMPESTSIDGLEVVCTN